MSKLSEFKAREAQLLKDIFARIDEIGNLLNDNEITDEIEISNSSNVWGGLSHMTIHSIYFTGNEGSMEEDGDMEGEYNGAGHALVNYADLSIPELLELLEALEVQLAKQQS